MLPTATATAAALAAVAQVDRSIIVHQLLFQTAVFYWYGVDGDDDDDECDYVIVQCVVVLHHYVHSLFSSLFYCSPFALFHLIKMHILLSGCWLVFCFCLITFLFPIISAT